MLEDNDVHQSIIADTYLPIARGRSHAPDETYLISTFTSPWYSWPLLVNGRDYFDFAQSEHPIHFEVDPSGHLINPQRDSVHVNDNKLIDERRHLAA